MQRIKFMIKLFRKEPWWFQILISTTLLISIIFSSSFFSNHAILQSGSKIAAAIFFGAFAIKFKRNRVTSVIFIAAAVTCMFLSMISI
jgi:hypothetical protein